MDKGVFHANPANGQGNGTIRVTCDAGSEAGNNIFYVKDRSGHITRQIVVKRNAPYVPPLQLDILSGEYNPEDSTIEILSWIYNALEHVGEIIHFGFVYNGTNYTATYQVQGTESDGEEIAALAIDVYNLPATGDFNLTLNSVKDGNGNDITDFNTSETFNNKTITITKVIH